MRKEIFSVFFLNNKNIGLLIINDFFLFFVRFSNLIKPVFLSLLSPPDKAHENK